MVDQYVSLHTHGEHSFLDGLPTMGDLVDRVVELGQTAVAITDHGEVSGHLRLQKAASGLRKQPGGREIKTDRQCRPIYGIETYMAEDRFVRDGKKGENYDHMVLWAKDDRGLRNLWALSSRAYIEGSYYANARCDWELLREYHEGLIGSGACLSGVIPRYLNEESPQYNPDKAAARLARLLEIFGEDFFLEIHTFRDPTQVKVNYALVKLASDMGVPLIAVSDAHYLRPDDWEDHELLTALQMGLQYDDPKRYQYGPNQLCMFGEAEVRERLAYLGEDVVDEAVANTAKIAAQCDASLPGTRSMPVFFDTPETDLLRLRRMAEEGFDRKIRKHVTEDKWPEYEQRLEYESGIIASKGFPGYFLTVADIVRWAKGEGMLVGPGRGSASGSLLSYVLDITEIDPIKAGLIFERFLDPGREALPDVDLDFPQLERPMVRKHLEDQYGLLNVATIGTLNKLAPKTLMRDLGRGLRVPLQEINAINKIVDQMPDLEVAHVETPWSAIEAELGDQLRPYLDKYPRLFALMGKFGDHIRHAGAHAAGVVLSKESLLGRLPLRFKSNDIRTQVDFNDVEELGFVKIDILGLRTLSTLMRAYKLAKQNHPEADIPFYHDWQYDWDRFYEDPKVHRSLWAGKNIGVFQLESAGLRQLAKRFQPTSLADVCHMISVYRPGITRTYDEETGLNLLELYLQKRGGERQATYKHELLRPILEPTHGNFLYQEQIMKVCNVMAGYSLAETDRVRKILGKKLVEKMKLERVIFVEGCGRNDISAEVANSVFDDMVAFGLYGFNLAHGYAYAMIAYWTAYMKHYFPREFMTALFQTNEEDSPLYARECQRLGIPLRGPDINESEEDFTLTPGGVIRYGLAKIKYVASGSKYLAEFRPFTDVADFTKRMPKDKFNKRAATSAIVVGALDSLVHPEDEDRFPGWPKAQIALRLYLESRKDKVSRELDNPCREADCVVEHSNFDHLCAGLHVADRGFCEKEYLGSHISHDPLAPYVQLLSSEENFPGEDNMLPGEVCRLGGTINRVRPLVTKKGKNPGSEMCQFWVDLPVVVADESPDGSRGDEQVQIVTFPDAWQKHKAILEAGAPVLCDVRRMDEGLSLVRLFRLDQL